MRVSDLQGLKRKSVLSIGGEFDRCVTLVHFHGHEVGKDFIEPFRNCIVEGLDVVLSG